MPSRYLALALPNAQMVDAIQDRVAMPFAYQSSGLTVLSDRKLMPIGDLGVVIGDLFARDGAAQAVTSFTRDAIESIAISAGRHLIEAYWGGYVAILRPPRSDYAIVLRDPSGAQQCYFAALPGGGAAASDVKTLLVAAGKRAQIAWDQLGVHLQSNVCKTDQTAIDGVRELMPAFSISLSEAPAPEPIWSPWDYAARTSCLSQAQAAERLREAIHTSVCGWKSRFDRVSLGVSGGLDSSIVAAELAATKADATCFTLATDDPSGDERDYARCLTQALGLSLQERAYRVEMVDIRRPSAPHLPRPMIGRVAQVLDQERERLQQEEGVRAHFVGSGGDGVFCYLRSAAPVVDRLQAQGPRRAWRTLKDVAKLTNVSGWTVGKLAFEHMTQRTQFRPPCECNRFMPMDLAGLERQTYVHPWLNAPRGIGPGKARHVAMLTFSETGNVIDPARDDAPIVAPFLSQIVRELCLAIPSWVWLSDGVNRAIARQAYTNVLPAKIINRTSKAGPSSFVGEVFRHNRANLKELLLQGGLAAAQLIDHAAIEDALSTDRPIPRDEQGQLLDLAALEAWVRHWS